MSNLLSQASLVMIPSGYKEDVVYSQIPTSGAGDLSFTRASNGTRINSAGLVEVCPWNLLQYSEDFTNAYWTKNRSSITANSTTAPNGTTTADSLIEDTANGTHEFITVLATQLQSYNFSIYAKANTRSKIQLVLAGSPWATGGNGEASFDLSLGTVISAVNGATGTIENVGNGWYRCTIAKPTSVADPSGVLAVRLLDASGNSSYTGNGTSGAYYYGAQLNIGSTANPYFPTTDRLNVPRLTYQNGGGGCPSLLLEKQSTNYVRNNNDLTGWTKITGTDTISLNAGTSPDGTANGINLIPSTANGTHMFYDGSTNVSSSGNFTMSCYAKANGYSKFSMRESASVGYYASFNLSNGTVIDNGGNTASIENLGNGWYRCICSVVASTSVQIGLLVLSDSYTSGQPFGLTWSGDGTKGILVYGPQLEVSSSYATSLISTAGVASATRVADICYKTGISSLIGQTEGTVFVDINITKLTENEAIATVNSGGYANNTTFQRIGNTIQFVRNSATQSGASVETQTISIGRHKMAIAYKSGDTAFYLDGSQVSTTQTQTFTNGTLSILRVGTDAIGALPITESFNEVILFPTRLTNAELASLTTI